MSAPRTTLHTAVSSDRLVAAATVVALLEGLLRLGLAIRIDPLAVVLWPPIVAVAGLAWGVPSVRAALNGDDAATTTDGIVGRLPSLVVVALGGHALAVALGTALFLVVDTPIRYLLYWTGRGDLISFELVTVTPLFGVTAGTFVAWVVPAIAVVRVAEGDGVLAGLRGAVATAVRAPRRLGWPLLCHYAFVCPVAVAIFVAGSQTKPEQWTTSLFGSETIVATLAVVGLIAVFVAALWLALSLSLTLERAVPSRDWAPKREPPTVSIRRLAVAALVVTSLVAGVGAIRVGEIRPVDTSPEPLSDDPDELYATAFENTFRASYESRHFDHTDGGGTDPDRVVRIDREDRQYVWSTDGDVRSYRSMGTATPRSMIGGNADFLVWETTDQRSGSAAIPGYPYAVTDAEQHVELSGGVEGWTVRERTDEEIVLELSDPDQVYNALVRSQLQIPWTDIDVHESWARVTVDAERETLSEVELRLHFTRSRATDADETHDIHRTYQYESDIDAERPDELGAPSAGEWLWKLFAY